MCSLTPPGIPSVFSSVLSSEPGHPHLTRTVPRVGDYGGPVLDLSGLDLEEIAAALADQTDYEHRWLISPETGEVVFWTSDAVPARADKRPGDGPGRAERRNWADRWAAPGSGCAPGKNSSGRVAR
jgi:hypothetical protein